MSQREECPPLVTFTENRKKVEILRKLVQAPHDHYEGQNECSICDSSLIDDAIEIIENQADEIERLKLDIAEALRAVTNQDALVAATINMCADEVHKYAERNSSAFKEVYAGEAAIRTLAPPDVQKALTKNQDALIEATIKLCAQKCTNIATSNGNSDCTKIAADWCGRVILSLVPEDAQRELNEN